VDFRVVVSAECLQLTVTGPNLTVEKQFDQGTSPSLELPYPAADGAYRWQLSRSDNRCGAKAPKAPASNLPDDGNGRSGALHGRPERVPVGPYLQSGGFQVANGTIVPPSNATEPGRKK
jgi:hypothetical protein